MHGSRRRSCASTARPTRWRPQPAGPQPAGPQPAGPQPAGPQPAGPQPAGPQPAGPRRGIGVRRHEEQRMAPSGAWPDPAPGARRGGLQGAGAGAERTGQRG
ncbi:MAG TPA: hypothetical protein ENK18_18230 [Deltaproteobacteria bacterium]|nr:hypothetical protein [Deltaproteobacteria bacterium]